MCRRFVTCSVSEKTDTVMFDLREECMRAWVSGPKDNSFKQHSGSFKINRQIPDLI
jgi:hypothetical protein